MKLFTTSEVIEITGISKELLKYLCRNDKSGKIYLIPFEIGRGQGSQSKYTEKQVEQIKKYLKLTANYKSMKEQAFGNKD